MALEHLGLSNPGARKIEPVRASLRNPADRYVENWKRFSERLTVLE